MEFRTLALVAVLTASAAAATSASAEVACNRWNECWRVHDNSLRYPAGSKVTYHDDKWASHHTGIGWRWLPDQGARGYYWHGVWRRF